MYEEKASTHSMYRECLSIILYFNTSKQKKKKRTKSLQELQKKKKKKKKKKNQKPSGTTKKKTCKDQNFPTVHNGKSLKKNSFELESFQGFLHNY